MRAKAFLCAESTSVDIRRNSLSIFHLIEDINAPSFPIIMPRLSVVLFLDRTAEEPNSVLGRLEIRDEHQLIGGGPVMADFLGQLNCRIVLDFQGFVIPSPGRLRAEFLVGDNRIGEWEMTARIVPQMQATPGPTPAPQPQASDH
jgi:hypothetical protein